MCFLRLESVLGSKTMVRRSMDNHGMKEETGSNLRERAHVGAWGGEHGAL